jgi:hypothetical protein
VLCGLPAEARVRKPHPPDTQARSVQKATIIRAHIGTGRLIRPVKRQGIIVEQMLKDSALGHVYFDISWDEVAKYAVATPESTKTVADLINRDPNRFLFGTDEVAPPNQEKVPEGL